MGTTRVLRLLVALSLLLVGAALLRPAGAAQTSVPCDVPALHAAVDAAGTNGEDDVLVLEPGCTYVLERTLELGADGAVTALRVPGNPAVLEGSDAVQLVRGAPGARVELQGLVLRNGLPRVAGGLAVGGAVEAPGPLVLDGVTVAGTGRVGTAAARGAAVSATGGLLAVGTTVLDNDPGPGSVVFATGLARFVNSSFAGSGTSSAALASDGDVRLVSSTFGFNPGAAVEVLGGSVRLVSSVLSQNMDACRLSGGVVQDGGGNVVSDTSCGLEPGSRQGVSARLEQPALDTGPTAVMRLGAGSPALGAGNGGVCQQPVVEDGTGGVDQRGFPRPDQVACDAGAVEQGGYLRPPPDQDFGAVMVSGSDSRLVPVVNDGDEPVQLGQVALTGSPDMTVDPACDGVVVPAGGSCTVTVTYAPLLPGDDAATLSVPSDQQGGAARTASVTGSGAAVESPPPSPSPSPTDAPPPPPDPSPSPTDAPPPPPDPSPSPTDAPPPPDPSPSPTDAPPPPDPSPSPTDAPPPPPDPSPSPTGAPPPPPEPSPSPTDAPPPPEPAPGPTVEPAPRPSPPPPAPVPPPSPSDDPAPAAPSPSASPAPSGPSASPESSPAPGPVVPPAPTGAPRPSTGPQPSPSTSLDPATIALQRELDTRRGSIPRALTPPGDISFDPQLLAANALWALLLLALIGIPLAVLNASIESHRAQLADLLVGVRRPLARLRPRVRPNQPTLYLSLAVLSALVYSQLQPGMRLDSGGAVQFFGLLATILVTSIVTKVAMVSFLVARLRTFATLRLFPGFLLLALACVTLTRVLELSPGLILGSLGGLAVARTLSEQERGRRTAFAYLVTLSMSVYAYLAWGPVADAAARPDSGLEVRILDTVLASVALGGVEGIALGLMPIAFLDGPTLRAHSPRLWAALWFGSCFVFVHLAVNPTSGADAYVGREGYLSALLVVYVLVAAAVWTGFRRWDAHTGSRARLLMPEPSAATSGEASQQEFV